MVGFVSSPEEIDHPKQMTLEEIVNGTVSGREALEWLHQQDKYVFHGTPEPIESLEPRQAFNHDKPDGPPAIFATDNIDIAIFRSLVHREHDKKANRSLHKSSFDLITEANGQSHWEFHTLIGERERIVRENRKGYVVAISKEGFKPNREGEVVAYQSVKPVAIVQVSSPDLPEIKEDLKM